MKNFVIVESPTKARTLTQFLGSDYEIVASMGHVRDLPKGEFGVDVEHNFEPKYVIPKNKMKMVNQLVKSTEGAKNLYLATDPDREGEAIAWNLLRVIEQKSKAKLGGQKYQRVVFHEITKDAVMDAFSHPREIDRNLVEAQQARRVLDRLVGYKLSPLLWKKVKSKLSAGRVQSVALRLVVEREREIEAFKSDEYWVIEVELSEKSDGQVFIATLQKVGTAKVDIKNKEQADVVVGDLESAKYSISAVATKDAKKYPNPPFTTSTLQQTAANRLGFVPKRTMSVAQSLYEQGFITYMRTDSVNLSDQAVKATRKFIEDTYGSKYLPVKERHYKASSKLAQEAHEAIRPTNVQVTSDKLPAVSEDMRKLYDLIWKRMVVCQMAEAIVAETTVDIEAAGNKTYALRANGQQIKFDGWYKVYQKAPITEQILPAVAAGDSLDKRKVDPQQKFTEPPPRYTEATLIRDLEKNGIGRPSTYAPTISTLYDRLYIEKMEGKKIAPTPIGKTTVDFLMKYFSDIFDYSFTAEMEDDLDSIAQGEREMPAVMEKFWGPFEKKVEKVTEEADKMKVEVETTDEVCEKCGKPMVVRYGRFGKFLACSGFPDCKNTKALNADTGMKCPDCKDGDVVTRKTKRGKTFWGCSNWPKCKFASWTKPQLKVEKAPNEEKAQDAVEELEEPASDK
ncbi:MAG: topoisomerase protein [Candidatus Curtissbacteria bacterium GW2011_GWA1_40_16]|uniref:DNA topoisomerase 1 n=1 Tax=Candidatus Curtissbacteria bacterium GW2011_GWA1_40_16 TaxID=1618405 RepID=A0A0G0RFJ5_9BACT|nr:MAG: topoisomerase protein [Candidatus Curtissbacteria bacterium GW2011_GWA1_40_16]